MAFFKVLVVLAALIAAVSAQNCIGLGGGLLSVCDKELQGVEKNYPLNSDTPPTEEQIAAVLADAKANGLPRPDCCTSSQAFDAAACQCVATLPTLLSTLGVEATQVGLVGAISFTRQLCKYESSTCPSK